MNKKFFNVLIISLCSILVLTLAATGFVLYSDYKTGAEAADKRFEKLFSQTEEAIARIQETDSEFIAAFNKAVGSPEFYYSINLKSSNQEIYVYPAVTQTQSKLFTVTKSRRITEGNNLDLNLTVCIYTLPASIIFSRLKITFIITLVITLSSALALIYLYLNKKDNEDDEEFSFKEDSFSTEDDFSLDLDLPEEESVEQTTENQYEESFSETESTDQSYDTDFDISESEPVSDPTIVKYENTETAEPELETSTSTLETEPVINASQEASQTQVESDQTESSSSNELFSETTGFTSEKYLISRLESELARASSSELDLSLILIQIPNIQFETKCGIEVCNRILSIFHYKDIIFEYKNDGLAIIFNNADIDKALESSEQVYAEICSTLSQYDVETKPLFGIASRSLRFLPGERLITEAEQALLHAKEDPENPIIAFRVNPEKYRKYMASKE